MADAYPLTKLQFQVELDGFPVASFTEVMGLDSETEVIEYREGTEDITPRKIPGLTKYGNITLKRGVSRDLSLWEWMKHKDRRDGTITLLNRNREPQLRIRFRSGWPCRWELSDLDASSNEILVETLEISHQGFDIDV